MLQGERTKIETRTDALNEVPSLLERLLETFQDAIFTTSASILTKARAVRRKQLTKSHFNKRARF